MLGRRHETDKGPTREIHWDWSIYTQNSIFDNFFLAPSRLVTAITRTFILAPADSHVINTHDALTATEHGHITGTSDRGQRTAQ
jgi:hypothetical protein